MGREGHGLVRFEQVLRREAAVAADLEGGVLLRWPSPCFSAEVLAMLVYVLTNIALY